MSQVKSAVPASPRAVLLEVALGGAVVDAAAREELQQLVNSAGMEAVACECVRRDRPDAAYFIGSGKVAQIRLQAQTCAAVVVVIDVQLSPVQQRNLERELGLPVLDRTGLILEIFARRAQSRAGKLQVELARLDYLSTRLVRGWTHLERQRGGIGLRGGPGEKQIELDRRMIGVRVKQLREKLRVLDRQRGTQRRARARGGVLRVALVGYTNAGKSTLFNALAHAHAYCADQLFATLDTTSRRCFAAPDRWFVLSDTVGFVRELPHALVAAFRSTLEETVQADLLLHVIDAASAARAEQAREVEDVLAQIGAGTVPRLRVYNKIDQVRRTAGIRRDACGSIMDVWLSAQTGLGVELLRQAIGDRAATREQLRAGQGDGRSLVEQGDCGVAHTGLVRAGGGASSVLGHESAGGRAVAAAGLGNAATTDRSRFGPTGGADALITPAPHDCAALLAHEAHEPHSSAAALSHEPDRAPDRLQPQRECYVGRGGQVGQSSFDAL